MANVNISNAVITGITVDGIGQFDEIEVDKAAGLDREILLQSAASTRWSIKANSTAESGSDAGSDFVIERYADGGTALADAVTITRSTGNVAIAANLSITGSLSKGSGSFRIDHPVSDEHYLVHSFVEAPRGDLIYRGKVVLHGKTDINLDKSVGMLPGTFDALCREPQVFLQNISGWEPLKGYVFEGILHIECRDPDSKIRVNWLVIAERKDDHWRNAALTDEGGNLILEPAKS